MKDISKLSTKEIEEKINIYTNRYQALKEIIKDLKQDKAKDALEVQRTNYKLMINRLRKELSRRYGNKNDK
ncbi:MAG: hypothetical protein ACXVOH_01915 [Bacteroidia bacterium]